MRWCRGNGGSGWTGQGLEGLASGGFEQAQPDLADGGVCRHGVPETLEWDPPGDGDGRGVQELGDVRADGGETDDGVGLRVDDEAGAAGVVVGVEARSGDGGEVVLDDANVQSESPVAVLYSIAMIQRRSAEVREALLREALALAIAGGVDAVSTRAVCTAVGVQAPTLYHYFGDRAGLLRAVVDQAFEEYFERKDTAAATPSSPHAEVAAGWDAHVAFAHAYPGLYPAMYPLTGERSAHLERSAALLRAGFDRLHRQGALADGVTPAIADAALRAALRGVAHAVAANPDAPDNQQVSATVRDALLTRILAPHEMDTTDG